MSRNIPDSLSNSLFGKRPTISDEVIDIISNPDLIAADDRPFPVRVLPYLDPITNRLKNQLDSRGIRVDESLTDLPGVRRINPKDHPGLFGDNVGDGEIIEAVFEDPQADLKVAVRAHTIEFGRKVILTTNLLPNSHNITSTGPKHYVIDHSQTLPIYKYPNPNTPNIGGFNFSFAKKYAIVDLINE